MSSHLEHGYLPYVMLRLIRSLSIHYLFLHVAYSMFNRTLAYLILRHSCWLINYSLWRLVMFYIASAITRLIFMLFEDILFEKNRVTTKCFKGDLLC
jgi:hypothetical protein